MIDYYNNAAKHNNTQYISVNKKEVMPENAPITSFGYALPKKTAEWIDKLYGQVGSFSNSFTLTGVSDTLVSSHNTKGRETTVTSAIKMYQKSIEKIKKSGTTVNMDSPNKYLWEYTDRFLNSPIGSSQYVYETDTVPFLQMVLNGTMEVYAPYSNFSFYSQSDMLRMIDGFYAVTGYLSDISHLTQLTLLNLHRGYVITGDISNLAGMTALTEGTIDGCGNVTGDTSSIAALHPNNGGKLSSLTISGTKVTGTWPPSA